MVAGMTDYIVVLKCNSKMLLIRDQIKLYFTKVSVCKLKAVGFVLRKSGPIFLKKKVLWNQYLQNTIYLICSAQKLNILF